ncbi:phosphotransferase family protein [Halalkalibaculum sp. DA3122]
MQLSKEKIYALISDHLPQFERVGSLESLRGGNLNYVWRLRGKNKNLIIKHAPPYIASNPDIPLNNNRIDFEARALELFESAETLSEISSAQVRPPERLLYEPNQSLLVMEDIGSVPAIDSWLSSAAETTQIGSLLGHFIGQLHKKTFNDSGLRKQFNNKPIQETRNQVQYQPAADYASEIISIQNTNFEARTKALGEKLLDPGKCLVMGDLWPASILIKNGNLRLIDWEFVHYGRPLQDAGHFVAHCWMQAHTASSSSETNKWKQLWLSFWRKYQHTTGEVFEELFNQEEHDFMTTHIAAEVLVRAAGPFKDGYIYKAFPPSHPKIEEAVNNAIQISERTIASIWDFLPGQV